jgi:hypothetical protein
MSKMIPLVLTLSHPGERGQSFFLYVEGED